MYQIRRGVFETNSSSTHSICITNDNRNLQLPDQLEFVIGEFGWECRKLTTPEKKASYLYTAICELYEKDETAEIANAIFEMLAEEGITCEFATPQYEHGSFGDYLDNGYIDHATGGELYDFVHDVVNNKRRLLRYLFSSDSFILTGNDNDDKDVDINVGYDHDEYYKGN